MFLIRTLFLVIFFGLNANSILAQETKKKCRINSNKQVLDFVKKELKPLILVQMKKDLDYHNQI